MACSHDGPVSWWLDLNSKGSEKRHFPPQICLWNPSFLLEKYYHLTLRPLSFSLDFSLLAKLVAFPLPPQTPPPRNTHIFWDAFWWFQREKAESFQAQRELSVVDFVSLLDILEKIRKKMLILICWGYHKIIDVGALDYNFSGSLTRDPGPVYVPSSGRIALQSLSPPSLPPQSNHAFTHFLPETFLSHSRLLSVLLWLWMATSNFCSHP